MERLAWPVLIQPLPALKAGWFPALLPDLPGGMSDGAPGEIALSAVQAAIRTRIEAANNLGHPLLAPMWYFDADATRDVAAMAGPASQVGSGQGAGERLEGYGPDRK